MFPDLLPAGMTCGAKRRRGAARISHAWTAAVLMFLLARDLSGARIGSIGDRNATAPVPLTTFAYDPVLGLSFVPEPTGLRGVSSFHYGQAMGLDPYRPGIAESAGDRLAALHARGVANRRWENQPPKAPRVFDVDRWTGEDGLPSSKVRTILQTRDGYLWIGTARGLARFDGVRLTPITIPDSLLRRGGQPGVRCLFEDRDGRLWVGTTEGLLYWSAGVFFEPSGADTLTGGRIQGFAFRRSGGLWIATDSGVRYWDGSGIREFPTPVAGPVYSLVEDGDGILWIGDEHGLATCGVDDPDSNRRLDLTSGRVTGLFIDSFRRLWIGATFGVWRMDSSDAAPSPVAGDWWGAYARFTEDSEGAIWVSTQRENVPSTGSVVRIGHGGEAPMPLPIETAIDGTMCVWADREGVLWAGGQGGLFRLRKRPVSTAAWGENNRFAKDIGTVGFDVHGALWMASGTWWGRWSRTDLWMFVPASSWSIDPLNPPVFPMIDAASIEPDLAPMGAPLLKGFRDAPDPSTWFPEVGTVQAITPGRDASLWIGSEWGLCRISHSGVVQRIHAPLASRIQVLLEDSRTNLWIGTAGHGLFRWSEGGLEPVGEDDESRSLSVTALHRADDGSLWMGTPTGLRWFHQGRAVPVGPGSSLPQDEIQGILEDDSGRFWISHASGMVRVERRALERWLRDPSVPAAVATLGLKDGLLVLRGQAGPHPCTKGPDGRLWFGRRGGLCVVDPAEAPSVPAPQVFLERVVANGDEVASDLPGGPGVLNLRTANDRPGEPEGSDRTASATRPTRRLAGAGPPPRVGPDCPKLPPGGGRRLEFHFTATSLHSPERVDFRYRLDGHESEWRGAGHERSARYHDIPAGRYVFRVQARNHEGRWSERDAIFAFQAVPFFWETWSFRAMCGLTAFGGVGAAMRWRLHRQHRRLESRRRKELEEERCRIARDLHDHLGSELTAAAYGSVEGGDVERRILASLRELGDLIWVVHPEHDTLESLAGFITEHATHFLAATRIGLDLDIPPVLPDLRISNELRRGVAAMLKETLHNVVQHADASQVTVRMRLDRGLLILTVRDNGRGFDPAVHRSVDPARRTGGHGLGNLRTRCAQLGGSCDIRPDPGCGVEVELILPLRHPGPGEVPQR